MASPKFDYGVLSYYPTAEAWVISFVATDPGQSKEWKASARAEGVRGSVFEAIGALGDQGWVVFQVDGYTDRDYPVYHLRRVRD